jgi:hypothetical protein
LGVCLWIGGGIGAMMIALGARQEPNEVRAAIFRLLARVQTTVIGLGALLVLASGVLWTMDMYSDGMDAVLSEPSRWVMIVVGLIAGLIVLFVGLPTATRLGGLAVTSPQGELPAAFEVYRKRLMVVSCLAGALALLALLAWVML